MENIYGEASFKFKELVAGILKENDFKLTPLNDDYLNIKYQNQSGIVGIKFYRNRLARLNFVQLVCQQLLDTQKHNPNKVPLLIISNYITDSFKKAIKVKFGIIIWDIKELFSLAFGSSELYYQLHVFLFETFDKLVGEPSVNSKNNESENIISDFKDFQCLENSKDIVKLETGRLFSELYSISEKEQYSEFEEICTEILKYLFEDDLRLWEPQNITSDGLHRFDLLCRLRPSGKNFWEELLNDFHSRYIVFEFKNYSEPIKQNQIYTTEKYLFKTALRSVAFIIARNDGDPNAHKAARGALTEAGKLIIILTTDDLIEMLAWKDRGDDPSEVLRNKVDEVLIAMSR
ncbi:hypothetical protein EZS27_028052 [termite gut metagenome]|uniref:Restriction endonuclease type IV Mrr domain-containing protein n=1 Tax=termite gut metagenome TaxID=433724 RepID=A0A5J4QN40_9ZZZZ